VTDEPSSRADEPSLLRQAEPALIRSVLAAQ
jgi:hypothetical protein